MRMAAEPKPMCVDIDDSCGGWDDAYAAIKESIKNLTM